MSVKEVKSLDDLSLPEAGTIDIPRGDSALRVPIKAISLEEQERLSEEYKEPSPPKKMDKKGDRSPTGKPGFYFDDTDPLYLKLVEETSQSQTRALAITGIDIDLPGEDVDEKWASLSAKLTIGDLSMILGAIMEMSNISDEKVEEAKRTLVQ